MNHSDWELILVLAEERNITKAAERLYTSQSTISYHLKRLENELGATLLERNKDGVTLTLAGQLFLGYAEEMQLRYEALKDQLRSAVDNSLTGKISVGITTSLAQYIFPYVQRSFSGAFPRIKLQLYSQHSDQISEMIRNHELDVGVVRGEVEWSQRSALIYEEPILLASKGPIRIEELPSAPLSRGRPGSSAKTKAKTPWRTPSTTSRAPIFPS